MACSASASDGRGRLYSNIRSPLSGMEGQQQVRPREHSNVPGRYPCLFVGYELSSYVSEKLIDPCVTVDRETSGSSRLGDPRRSRIGAEM